MTTSNLDQTQSSYNKYEYFPQVSYNITKYMMSNNELIWKLISYTDPHAYKNDSAHPNLTTVQKSALIFDGVKPETDCRIFFDVAQDDAWTTQVAFLRISPVELVPTNYVYGNMSIGFEIYCHYRNNMLSNYSTRLDMITQQILETLNGADLGAGVGRLNFDARASSRSRMSIIGSIPYKGHLIIMNNKQLG